MAQVHNLDDSGDFGLDVPACASSHIVLAMVQLPSTSPLPELASLRRSLRVASNFEFKYAKTTWSQKVAFFSAIEGLEFRGRAVAFDKPMLAGTFSTRSGLQLQVELIAALVLKASSLDIADDVLVLDGTPESLIRILRARLPLANRATARICPFRKMEKNKTPPTTFFRGKPTSVGDLIGGGT